MTNEDLRAIDPFQTGSAQDSLRDIDPFQPGYKPPPTLGGEFVKGVKSGTDNLQGAAYGVAGIVGDKLALPAVRDWGLEGYKRNQAEAQENAPAVGRIEDIASVGDAARWVAGGVGQLVPSAATAIAGAGAGGALARLGAQYAAKRVGQQGAAQAARKIAQATEAGAIAGAGATSVGVESGQNYGNIVEKTGQHEPNVALGYGAAAGALDLLPQARLIRQITGRTPVQGVVREARNQAGREAATEAGQTILQRGAVRHVDPTQEIFTAEGLSEIGNAAALGAVGGGLAGGAGQVLAGSFGEPAVSLDPRSQAIQRARENPDAGPLERASAQVPIPETPVSPEPVSAMAWYAGLNDTGRRALLNALEVDERDTALHAMSLVTSPNVPAATRSQAAEVLRDLAMRHNFPGVMPEPRLALPDPNQTPVARAAANIAAWSQRYPAVPLDQAQALQAAAIERGADLVVAPHASGSGFTVVPRNWVLATTSEPAALPDPRTVRPGGEVFVNRDGTARQEQYRDENTGSRRAFAEFRAAVDKPAPPSSPVQPIKRQPALFPFADRAAAERAAAPLKAQGRAYRVTPHPDVAGAWTIRRMADVIDEGAHQAATSPRNNLPEPTEAQKAAGNYQKGRVTLHGMEISIENPKGSVRSGVDRDGKPWSRTMAHHYGGIRRTTGADGDKVDVFIGPDVDSDKAFVIDQVDPQSGKFDESKIMLGFRNALAARHAYHANYAKDWKGFGRITGTDVAGLRKWLDTGDTTRAFFDYAQEQSHANRRSNQATSKPQQSPASRAGPASTDGVRRAGDPVPRNAPRSRTASPRPVTRALGITEHFEEHRSTALIGQRVNSAQDLAELAQIFRSPKFETFRLFLLRGNEVVQATGVTSRMPGFSAVVPKGMSFPQYIAHLQDLMKSAKADGFWMLHNHPSGNAEASRTDEAMTKRMASLIPGFRGHVIVNSGTWSQINASGRSMLHTLPSTGPDALLTPSIPSPLLGKTITQGADIVAIGQMVKQDSGWVTVIGVSGLTGVRVIVDFPVSLSATPAKVRAHLKQIAQNSGAGQLFMYGPYNDLRTLDVDGLIRGGYLRAAVDERGNSASIVRPRGNAMFGKSTKAGGEVVEESTAPADVVEDQAAAFVGKVREHIDNLVSSPRTFNLWHRTIGTQFHKAHVDRDFGRVFRLGQQFLQDVSLFAMTAADRAPDILPKIGRIADLVNFGPGKADLNAVSRAVFQGTLTDERVYSDSELSDQFGLTEKQIDLYRQTRAAIDQSLDDLGASEMARLARSHNVPKAIAEAKQDPQRAAAILVAALIERIKTYQGDTRSINSARADIAAIQEHAQRLADLKLKGYAPLMRFGKYTVYVVGPDGEQRYFGLFESRAEANRMTRDMAEIYPDSRVTQGVLSQDAWELFRGISPDTLELFAKSVGADSSPVFQEFLRSAINNRSALKRLIERKGIAGFSTDTPRVLSAFITSNARMAARNHHYGEMVEAVDAIPQQKGDVKDEATRLVAYLQNPKEEAAALRSLLFAQYLGGSAAAALVNMTQPVLQTFPFLAKFGTARAARALTNALPIAVGKTAGDQTLQAAMERAIHEGVVAPHELHQLYAQSIRGMGSNVYLQRALKAWGGFFALAESFNRRISFAAAFDVAQQMGPEGVAKAGFTSAYDFAVDAVVETQGAYNKGNRPNWARGPIGATAFTFKQFAVAYTEFLTRLPPRQRALALAVLVLAAGVQGLPFAEDLEDLIDTIGQSLGYATNSKQDLREAAIKILGEGWGPFLTHGLSSVSGMPIDVHARLGLSNLLPGTSIFKRSETDPGRDALEFAGPAGGLVRQAMDGMTRAQSGEMMGAAAAVAPKAVKDILAAINMVQSGNYHDTRGRTVAPVTTGDAVAKAIGFQPPKIADLQRRMSELHQDVSLARAVESQIAASWADAAYRNDREGVAAAMAQMRVWNERNPEATIRITFAQIGRRVREMKMTREQRFTRATPPEMRARVQGALNAEGDM